MKVLFICIMLTIFIWRFAIPWITKYMNSGLIEDVAWVERQEEDSPAITVCALNDKSENGWKSDKKIHCNYNSAMNLYCENSSLVESIIFFFSRTEHSVFQKP